MYTTRQTTCPNCGNIIHVRCKRTYKSLPTLCSNCKHYFIAQLSDIAQEQEGETTILSSQTTTKLPQLKIGDRTFPLSLGINRIGRKGEGSRSSIQIPSTDRTMSRENAIIEVARVANGKIVAQLSSCKANNLVILNGRPIQLGERLTLLSGVRFTLGQTIVEYSL